MIIYGLTSSELPGVIRYVGKTSQPLAKRVLAHISRAVRQPRDSYKENWIRSVLASGHQIQGVVIAFAVTDDEAYQLEHHYIATLKVLGFALTNAADRGPGPVGYRHSEAAKMVMSAKHKGRQRTLAELEKQRLAHLGKRHSDEAKRKMSATRTGKTLTPEHRLHLSHAKRGVPKSPDHRAKISEANQRRTKSGWQHTDAARQASGAANRGRRHTDDARLKMSAARTGRPKSPEHVEKQRLAQLKTLATKRALAAAVVPPTVM